MIKQSEARCFLPRCTVLAGVLTICLLFLTACAPKPLTQPPDYTLVSTAEIRLQQGEIVGCNIFSVYYGKEKAATRLQYLFYCLPTYRTDGNHELFSKTLQYIHANLYTLRSNGELGAAMNYHPYYLNKLFKERTGFSIHQYVLKLRLEKAVSLLQNTHHPIRDVAKACGFEDPRHFSSAFSKKYGYTPTQARKNGGILL